MSVLWRTTIGALLTVGLLAAPARAGDGSGRPRFEPPQRLRAAGSFLRVDAPGFACPHWGDADGDGVPDLLVGQFDDGKIQFYRGRRLPGASGAPTLAPPTWLEAAGEVAQVPGVW